MMGLTRDFAQFVLFCRHTGASDNSPFESTPAYGACSRNEGKLNARVLTVIEAPGAIIEKLIARHELLRHFLSSRVGAPRCAGPLGRSHVSLLADRRAELDHPFRFLARDR